MEETELTVTVEPERLDALFLSAKEKSTPQRELQRALEKLYVKYVPAEMREVSGQQVQAVACPASSQASGKGQPSGTCPESG